MSAITSISVVNAVMTTIQQHAFCVIKHDRSELMTVVQRAFRTKYSVRPPDRGHIKVDTNNSQIKGVSAKGKVLDSRERVKNMLAVFRKYLFPVQKIDPPS